jgi:hypothetical protein
VHEDVGIAVGIDAAAPADQEGLELAGLACLNEVANSMTRIFSRNRFRAIDCNTWRRLRSRALGTIMSTATGA